MIYFIWKWLRQANDEKNRHHVCRSLGAIQSPQKSNLFTSYLVNYELFWVILCLEENPVMDPWNNIIPDNNKKINFSFLMSHFKLNEFLTHILHKELVQTVPASGISPVPARQVSSCLRGSSLYTCVLSPVVLKPHLSCGSSGTW